MASTTCSISTVVRIMENDTNVFVMYKMEVDDVVLVLAVFFCLFVVIVVLVIFVVSSSSAPATQDTLLAFNIVFVLLKPILWLLYYSNFFLYTLFVGFLLCVVVPVGNDGNPCYVVSIYLCEHMLQLSPALSPLVSKLVRTPKKIICCRRYCYYLPVLLLCVMDFFLYFRVSTIFYLFFMCCTQL